MGQFISSSKCGSDRDRGKAAAYERRCHLRTEVAERGSERLVAVGDFSRIKCCWPARDSYPMPWRTERRALFKLKTISRVVSRPGSTARRHTAGLGLKDGFRRIAPFTESSERAALGLLVRGSMRDRIKSRLRTAGPKFSPATFTAL